MDVTMKSSCLQADSRVRKLSPLSPETLHIQSQLVKWTKSGRKHWDLFRHLLNVHLLTDATKLVLANAGSYGIDRTTCAEVKSQGREFVRRLREKLVARTYRPSAVRRVYIPKRDGRKRPLGIPTVEDRVIQRGLALLLEPVYEQSFLPCSYGFRPGRSAVQCAYDIAKTAYSHRFIIDADIEDFFGSVQHQKLLGMLKEKIVDPRVLDLIGRILRSGFEGESGWQETSMGTPQGGPLSPLLANIYLHHVLDEHFWVLKRESPRFELFRYADDLIVTCKSETDLRFIVPILRSWLTKGGLKFHPKKSRAVDMRTTNDRRKAKFDFLGFKFHLRTFKDNPGRTWVSRQPSVGRENSCGRIFAQNLFPTSRMKRPSVK